MRARTIPLLVAAGWLACVTAGCGGGPKPKGEVYGKVTVGGKPVTAGMVKFAPEEGEAVSTGLGPDGSYRATDVPVGRARVAVETLMFKNLTPPPPAIAKQLGGPRTKYVPIPEKYERPDSSGLTVEVERGKKLYDIELP
jgi:hypothetical protein